MEVSGERSEQGWGVSEVGLDAPRSADSCAMGDARRGAPGQSLAVGQGSNRCCFRHGERAVAVPVKGELRRPGALVRLLRTRRPHSCWSRADAGVVLAA